MLAAKFVWISPGQKNKKEQALHFEMDFWYFGTTMTILKMRKISIQENICRKSNKKFGILNVLTNGSQPIRGLILLN